MNTRTLIETPDSSSSKTAILNASFNQDYGCFAISTNNGFKVYNTDPFEIRVDRTFSGTGTGVGIVTMLHRTNYLALVGGGQDPFSSMNKVIIWDDLKKKKSIELEFNDLVKNVLLSRTRIVVVLQNSVVVYAFQSPPAKLIAKYETIMNVQGIGELGTAASTSSAASAQGQGATQDTTQILAFPGRSLGQIQISDISTTGQERNIVSIIKAHKSRIASLAINQQATMIASASETGTLIRIHSIKTCSLIYEFRRGLDKAIVYSMKFSPNGSKLAVLSDKLTLHVYSMSVAVSNKSHLFNNSLMPAYFKSQWSFASCHLIAEPKVSESSSSSSSSQAKLLHAAAGQGQGQSPGHNHDCVLGWADEDSIIIIWKKLAKWEKYVIVPKEAKIGEYELIRESWRKLT